MLAVTAVHRSELPADQAEFSAAGVHVPEAELCELVRQVAGLSLAVQLAAGCLRRSATVERFLAAGSAAAVALAGTMAARS